MEFDKTLRYGDAPVTDKGDGARDFHSTYGFFPTAIFKREADGNATAAYRYTFWNDFKRLPIFTSDGDDATDLKDRSRWLLNMFNGTDPDQFDHMRFTRFPVKYDCGTTAYHPTAIQWIYMGSTNLDMKNNELPDYKPCYIDINGPENRCKLFDILNKERRLPRLVDFNPMGKNWKGGIFQMTSGFILQGYLREGVIGGITAKPRQRSF